MKKIHLPSLLLGLSAAAGLFFLSGAGAVSPRVGNYQVASGDNNFAVRINTSTGESWYFSASRWLPITEPDK